MSLSSSFPNWLSRVGANASSTGTGSPNSIVAAPIDLLSYMINNLSNQNPAFAALNVRADSLGKYFVPLLEGLWRSTITTNFVATSAVSAASVIPTITINEPAVAPAPQPLTKEIVATSSTPAETASGLAVVDTLFSVPRGGAKMYVSGAPAAAGAGMTFQGFGLSVNKLGPYVPDLTSWF